MFLVSLILYHVTDFRFVLRTNQKTNPGKGMIKGNMMRKKLLSFACWKSSPSKSRRPKLQKSKKG